MSKALPFPIFVLGAPGLPCPTLAASLGALPTCYGTPEINLPLSPTVEAFVREMSGPRMAQAHGVLRLIATLYGGEQKAIAVDMARRWLDVRGWMPSDQAMQEIVERIAPFHMTAPITSAIHQPSAMRRLQAAFPDARYVVMRAHPRIYGQIVLLSQLGEIAVLLSGSLDESYEPPLPDPQHLWLQSERATVAALSGIGKDRVIDVRAEDLVRNSEATLRELATALGLDDDAKAIAAMCAPEASVFAGPGPIGAHSDLHIRSYSALARAPEWQDEQTLEGPLPWRPDEDTFLPEVIDVAKAAGFR